MEVPESLGDRCLEYFDTMPAAIRCGKKKHVFFGMDAPWRMSFNQATYIPFLQKSYISQSLPTHNN